MLNAIIFGILQGIFEWLPISSQGNLVLVMVGLLGIDSSSAMNYAVFLHTGTLLAAIVYFRKEIVDLLKHLPKYRPKSSHELDKVTNFLVVSTLLTGLIGFPIYKTLQNINLPGEYFIGLIGLALIVTGLIQKNAKKSELINYKKTSTKDGILLGLAQALSAIPGISRSGITTSTLLFRKYKPKNALRLSFLMSVPAIFGAEIGLSLIDGFGSLAISDIIIGIVCAFISGLLTIHALIKIAEKVDFWKFCIFLGILAITPIIFLI